MKIALQVALSTAFAFFVPGICASDTWLDASADTPIDQVVVVAHKTERPIRDVAANVTVLSKEDFHRELAMSMGDVLRYAPGVDVEAAGPRFGSEGINIRGIGGNRVAVFVDGVPLSDQFDIGNFANATRDFIDAGFVDRAEILHGPASAIYGSAAIGGVVALRTPEPADLARRDAQGGYLSTAWSGTDASANATTLQSLRRGDLGLLLGVNVRDGATPDSSATHRNPDSRDYRRLSTVVKLVADDVRGNTWKLGYYDHAAAVESSLQSMLGSARFRDTTVLEGDDSSRMNLWSVEYQFDSKSSWVDDGIIRGYSSRTGIDQRTRDERGMAARPVSIARRFGFEQSTDGFELNLQKRLARRRAIHRIGAGIEYRRRHTTEVRDGLETGLEDGVRTNVLLGEIFPLRDFPVSDSTDWGIYVEDAVSIGGWTLIGAIRGDRYELDPVTEPIYSEDYPFAPPVSVSAADVSPKLGFVRHWSPHLDVYAQYVHGFRAPPYADANIGLDLPLFNLRAVPNPDLESERSDGIDLGMRWHGSKARAHVTAFRTRYQDFIESKARLGVDSESGRILFQSRNIREAVIEGVEAGGSLTVETQSGTFAVDGACYRARGKNRDGGQPLNSVGPAQAVIGADWQPAHGQWQARIRATLTDGWSDRDETGGKLYTPAGYAVFDLYVSRSFGDSVRLRASVGNLTDQTYWSWSDVRGLGPDDPVVATVARPGRNLALGIEMNW